MEMKEACCKETAEYEGSQPWLRHNSICKGQHLQQEENFPAALSSQEPGKYLEKYKRCLLFVWSVVLTIPDRFSVIPVSHRPLLRYTVLVAALKRRCCVALNLGVKRLGCCYSCPTRLRLVCRAAQAADSLIGDQTEVLQLVLWRNSKSCLQFCLILPPETQNEYPFFLSRNSGTNPHKDSKQTYKRTLQRPSLENMYASKK